MLILEVSNVSKSYGADVRTPVLRNINLKMERGELVAIVGFSGAGKTTLISLIAGLLKPDRGTIVIDGCEVEGPGLDRGVVFQNYSLLPWLTVFENIYIAVDQAFGRWPRQQKEAHTEKYIELVHSSAAAGKRPRELSGGMRQRVALARALAMDPKILLLDEPLGALDALTRATLQDEIVRIWGEDQKTMVLITNDVDEGILLADRIIPLSAGPNATLGPSIQVSIPRPRNRKALNHDAAFKDIRRRVIDFLLSSREAKASAEPGRPYPVSLDDSPDEARAAAVSVGGRFLMAFLEISRLTKTYPGPGGPAEIVKDFTLMIEPCEFVSIIGHSGCGKSTVLSIVAGLSEASGGGIVLAGKEVEGPGPDRGVVFQSPCLLPWMTALENVLLGVEQVEKDATKHEAVRIATHYLELVGLADSITKRASELSAGMRQRVGIARAFALSPKLLLLDEPFGMLDSLTRWDLQQVLIDLWRKDQKTALMITHDVDEALFLSDRVVLMTRGPSARVGGIVDVPFERPRDRREVMERAGYYRLRERLIGFLEDESSEAELPAVQLSSRPLELSST